MADNERLLEAHLKRLDTNHASQSTELKANREMASQMALVKSLRSIAPLAWEVDTARERVSRRIWDAIAEEDEGLATELTGRAPGSLSRSATTPGLGRAARLFVAAAAIFLLTYLGSWAVSSAAGTATPDSPFYGLKRADEWLALHTAWSDQRRGQVYATIAWRRLTEAQFEYTHHHGDAAQRLAREYDGAMQRLIQLDATMQTRHENTSTVAQGIARNLDRAYIIAQAAGQSGETTLAKTLIETTQAEQAAINRANITLPSIGGHLPSGQPSGSPAAGHKATPTPSTDGAETPTAGQATATSTPGDGNGNGSGNGNGN